MRRTGFHHLAVFHDRAVGHTHGGTHGNHPAGRGHRGPDHAVQGVLLQHTVHIRTDEELVGDYVHAGVGSIGLGTAVHLVHHGQALEGGIVALGLVQALEGLGLDFLDVGIRHLHQVEVLDQEVQRMVLGTVVHDHHLEVRVVQAQQGQHVGDNRLFLIVGRCDDGYAGGIGGLSQFLYGVVVVVIRIVLLVLQESQDSKHHIARENYG